jgi:hypothetical protein
MRTVFTPDALARSVAKGGFKTCKLSEWKDADGDEAFLFIYPSPILENEMNGDGDLLEIIDFNNDLTEVDTDAGGGRLHSHKTTPDTVIYYR